MSHFMIGETYRVFKSFFAPAIEKKSLTALLSAVAPIDFSKAAFGVNAFAQTGIHHTPVLIHALPDGVYHIYGLRSFAQNLWDWLVDAAAGLR